MKTYIEKIKAAGFTHFKIELEAELDRENSESSSSECTVCNGIGYDMTMTDEYGDYLTCEDCEGDGVIRSDNEFEDEGYCERYIKDQLSPEARAGINYMLFYNDGSVDSELTATMPIEHPEWGIELINAFQKLADDNGGGMDVDGAGMHVSLLTSSNYPTHSRLDGAGIRNFRREVSKLLPALYIAACSGDFTRDLQYRYPRISDDDKYSAIYTHNDTCIEYRLFETCYQRPETLIEYLGTIARTVEYYADPSKKVAPLGEEYPVLNKGGLNRFIELPEQVRVIKKQMALVKPKDMTIKDMLGNRSIDLSMKVPRKKYQEKIREIKKMYSEHKKAFDIHVSRELDEYELDNVEYWRRTEPGKDESYYVAKVTGEPVIEDEQTYINNNLRTSSVHTSLAV